MPDHTAAHAVDQQPDLLTISEAAEVLRTPVATLRYWRHLGTGPHSFASAAGSSTGVMTSTPGSTLAARPVAAGP